MKKANKFICLGATALLGLTLLSACNNNPGQAINSNSETDTNITHTNVSNDKTEAPECGYNEGVVLVKAKKFNPSMLGELKYDSVEQLYKGSDWYKINLLADESTQDAISYLSDLNNFEKVDFDYIMGSDGEVESINVSGNPWSGDEKHLDSQGVKEAWKYLKKQGKNPGGDPSVVVAIIDTGVDYNHIDLRNNIWTNPGEIPNNGIDDDGNGYVDDYYGWDCVGDDNDPMDDNGHGTHVAGIVAAEDNSEGIVGVAFNTKIMCLKAGNSSGYFNNSDIAEAIQYAYMNGASVINMSFGGSSISFAVEDALEDAYNQCVLVAAAGNDALCNQPGCLLHEPLVEVCYPAALPYVIGVMSSNSSGTTMSAFSNFDHYENNDLEYEVFACGEQIPSTWPNNKVAKLSGTSMACPIISGIAGILRSCYPDRDIYSNKFIQSQIVNTSENFTVDDPFHSVVNAYDALTKKPKPNVALYDYYIFDNIEFSSANDGDGIPEAGETIRLALELHNRGGVASNVEISIDSFRNDDVSLTDPYFSFVNSSVSVSDIGTYSVRDFGKIYSENGALIGTNTFFEIAISEDCPNDYICDFNIDISYHNGLDNTDSTNYLNEGKCQLCIYKGTELPKIIDKDTVFDCSTIYLVNHDVIIPEGVTVTFSEGTEIIFAQNDSSFYDSTFNFPRIINYGELNFVGTKDKRIYIHPSDNFGDCFSMISSANFYYTDVINIAGDFVGSVSVGEGNYNAYYSTFAPYSDSYRWILINGEKRLISYCYNHFSDFIDSKYTTTPCYGTGANDNLSIDNANRSYILLKFGKSHYVTGVQINSCNNTLIQTQKIGNSNQINPVIHIQSGENNVFMTSSNSNSASECAVLDINSGHNVFKDAYGLFYDSVISNFYSSTGIPKFQIANPTDVDVSQVWLFVEDVIITNDEQRRVHTVNKSFNIDIIFNKNISDEQINVQFGRLAPFADYLINGSFVDEKTWHGSYETKAFIENGINYLRITNNADSQLSEIALCEGYFNFDINTSQAMSMNLQCNSDNDGIHLEWIQDDYDTLMGYNVYRSESKDGNYVRLNNSIIPAGENTFVDENAEPGKTYWYTFTVVLTDMSESAPAGKVSCTMADTIAPNIYHTPVNQGYLNNNLTISCTASDNVRIDSAKLFYRTKGAEQWKSLDMVRQNDKYSATIFGSELSLDGLEYYIVVSDGVNTISKGSAENPYSVIIKDASAISRIGDVDGDGVITTKDALMIMQAINGDLLLSDDEFKRADLNKDGVLSSVEALRILQYINGNVTTLEM